jgi:hypothetical protein
MHKSLFLLGLLLLLLLLLLGVYATCVLHFLCLLFGS